MFRTILFFLLLCAPVNDCFCLELNTKETVVLENFLCFLFQKSEGGYVFYGKKPVCMIGYKEEDFFLKENDHHLSNVILKEGAAIWKGLKTNGKDNDIIIHIYDSADFTGYTGVLLINKPLFLKTVKDHQTLFQYVLGPAVTPQSLFDSLTDPATSFHTLLKSDKVLTGILLGFGVQNSLYCSRIENLQADLLAVEQPPLARAVEKFEKLGDVAKHYVDGFLWNRCTHLKTYDALQPSFSYSSLKEELEKTCQQLDVSSVKLCEKSPCFIFGRLKNDPATEQLVEDLEKTQDQIVSLNASNQFLERVLKGFFPKEQFVINPVRSATLPFSEGESKQLPLLIAGLMRANLQKEAIDLAACVEGMQDAAADKPMSIQNFDAFKYKLLNTLKGMFATVCATDDFFTQLAQDPLLTATADQKIYYKIVGEGEGEKLDTQTLITAHYCIESPQGAVFVDTWKDVPQTISLWDTIPGFAWGVRGMKVGETRELFIHPKLAYGIYTPLEKGIYLKARVQLLAMREAQPTDIFPPLTVIDFAKELNFVRTHEGVQTSKKAGYVLGYNFWQHFKKGPGYRLEEILNWITLLQSGKAQVDLSLQANQDLINRLHWNIYHMQPPIGPQ